MNICVVGGGLSGLVAGYRLARKGHRITVLEKESKAGGMVRSFSENGDDIPIVYHHIMKSDKITRDLVKELGLWDVFFKRKTKMGFYSNGKIHKLSGPFDIFKFQPLSIPSRLKFLSFGLKIKLRRNWDELENKTAKEWITKSANGEIYDKIFEPLLKIKFSSDSDDIIARWVGERLKMSESSGPFGYLKGGLEQILHAMEKNIVGMGGEIRLNSKLIGLKTKGKRIVSVVFSEGGKKKVIKADRVIYTGPVSLLPKIVELPPDYTRKINGIKYKSTICAVIGLDRNISEYYWINFIKGNFSFGGIITHTHLNPYIRSSKAVLYVFTYLDKKDPMWSESDGVIMDRFVSEIDSVFGIRGSVKWKRLFRVEHSKPVYDISYKNNVLDYRTPIENLYLGGVALFYPRVRNMGTAIETGLRLAEIVDEPPRN